MDNTGHHIVACPACGAGNRVPLDRAAEDPVCGRCRAPLLDGSPITLTDANFERFVSRTELPVVVDFWAEWCGPCRMMAPAFEEAAARLKGKAILVKVDTDRNPQTASRFQVRSIPTLVRLNAGREVLRESGALPVSRIVSMAV